MLYRYIFIYRGVCCEEAKASDSLSRARARAHPHDLTFLGDYHMRGSGLRERVLPSRLRRLFPVASECVRALRPRVPPHRRGPKQLCRRQPQRYEPALGQLLFRLAPIAVALSLTNVHTYIYCDTFFSLSLSFSLASYIVAAIGSLTLFPPSRLPTRCAVLCVCVCVRVFDRRKFKAVCVCVCMCHSLTTMSIVSGSSCS